MKAIFSCCMSYKACFKGNGYKKESGGVEGSGMGRIANILKIVFVCLLKRGLLLKERICIPSPSCRKVNKRSQKVVFPVRDEMMENLLRVSKF